ncbi:LINE-1 retrotransposable element ORF2 protein [Yarrowia sp. E02]|nr:LINE-1 retrotransposable element ORF2 protein [Yarrowia sp. E02]
MDDTGIEPGTSRMLSAYFVSTTSRLSRRQRSSHHPVYFSFKFRQLTKPELVGKGTWREPRWIYFDDYKESLKDFIDRAFALQAALAPELRLIAILEQIQTQIKLDARNRAICLQAECRGDPELAQQQKDDALRARSPYDSNVPANESFTALKTRVKVIRKEANIPSLKGPDGTLYTDTPHISLIAQLFYKDIYEHKGAPQGYQRFLEKVPKPVIDQMMESSTQDNLDAPFTETELQETLKAAKHKSAPGMDGFTYKFYDTFFDQFKDLLLEVFELAAKGSPVSRQRNTSVIRLLPKDGDPTDISNYRPISLINTELKIFTHMVNRRMQKTMDFLVHPAQTGFVPTRQMSTNLSSMDHYINVYGKRVPWIVGMLDFRKAYDSISQEWIIMVLEHVGFPPRIVNCVKAVQAKAASTINIRGVLSGVVPLRSGVRQGCPLSPTLFAIAIDPFIRALESVMVGLRHLLAPSDVRKRLWEEIQELRQDNTQSKQRKTIKPKRGRKRDTQPQASHPPPESDPPLSMKVSAFADDVALFMSGHDDVRATGKVIVEFQAASKLCLNPSKTIVQWVRPPQDTVSPPDPILNEALAEFWPSAPPKNPGEPRQFTVPKPSGTMFRYLGIHFGDKEQVDKHYKEFIKKLETLLRGYALFGLKHHSKAWMLNMFFLSKLVFYIPYVESFTDAVVEKFRTMCCDKINGRLAGENKNNRRTFNDELIYQPLRAAGIGLLNIVEQARSLRATRAWRFFYGDSPARQNALFLFASEPVDKDLHPATRMNKLIWFGGDNWHWHHFLSKSMNGCLRELIVLSRVAGLKEPPFVMVGHDKWKALRETVGMFDCQRRANPVAIMSQHQEAYLMSQLDVEEAEAQNSWRDKFTVMKNDHWREILPPEIDKNDKKWLKANDFLGKHYRRDAKSAATLHMLRLSRLPFTRWYPKTDHYAYKDIGCSSCRLYKEKSYLHEHLFVNCPVSHAICSMIEVPLPARMADWILLEDKEGPLNYIRELAHALWQFERTMRRTGLVGTDPEVQRDHAHLFTRVTSAYRYDLWAKEVRERAAA